MSKISDLFSDEEKKQLSYLGSMLHQEPTEEEQDFQKMIDAVEEDGIMIEGKIVSLPVPVVQPRRQGKGSMAPHYSETKPFEIRLP